MKEEFFPKATIEGISLVLNTEAVETMELDTPDAKVLLMVNLFPDKPKSPSEVLIVKTNGSLCDDEDNIKDVFPVDHIRKVKIDADVNEVKSGVIGTSEATIAEIKKAMGAFEEFKLLACNTESVLAKEFRDQFNITATFYKLAYITDKRAYIGKEKNIKSVENETISI